MTNINDGLVTQDSLAKSLPWWQNRSFTLSVAILGLLLVLTMININVMKFETHLATGDSVLLELAPVDPRGFMQGDYMILRYALENEVFTALEKSTADDSADARNIVSADGYAIVTLDENNVGQFVRISDSQPEGLAANEMAIYYRIRLGSMKLATNAFFFQEGHAEAYEAAEYGLLRVNDKGEPLLTDMVDGNFAVIEGFVASEDTNDPLQ